MRNPSRKFLQTSMGHMHIRLAEQSNATRNPLICLHMTPQSGKNFENFIAAASADRLVIAPDYPGYGDSDRPPEDREVTIEDYARAICEIVDQMQLGSIDILGHHTGSKVAIEMAHQRPDNVNSLVLVSLSGAVQDQPHTPRSFAALPLDAEGHGIGNWWRTLHEFYGPDVPLETLFGYFTESLKPSSAFHWGFRAAHNYNVKLVEVLRRLTLPITVINPNDDLVEMTPKAMNFIQNGTLIQKPQWSHGFLDTKTDDAVETVLAALDDMNANKVF